LYVECHKEAHRRKKLKYYTSENDKYKRVRSEIYNYDFNKETGLFLRWGKNLNDDPIMAPSPEIADIEISTVCNGIGKTMDARKPCPWCYKSNTGCGGNMSLDTFKSIFHKLPKNLTQIAFGIGDIDGNPDLWDIMLYCRNNNYNTVIPNITTNGMGVDERVAGRLAKTCGAVSVSRYHIPSICYDAIAKLSGAGLKQVNIHQLLAEETLDSCYELFDDIQNDPRLKGLNAVVLLLLKPKGDRNKLHSITDVEKFKALFAEAQAREISIGMDSCSAPFMLKTAIDTNQREIIPSVEPCESTLFSVYMNYEGEVFPCSFTEGTPGWEQGINMADVSDFMEDVWNSKRVQEWRKDLIHSAEGCSSCEARSLCRVCPVYDITPCKSSLPSLKIL
jgi:radical SAM protein with 4Fe4S-binding SPASM domain